MELAREEEEGGRGENVEILGMRGLRLISAQLSVL